MLAQTTTSYTLNPAVFVVAAGLGLVVGLIARSKGRSFIGWWFFGFMLFIVAIILVLVLPARNRSTAFGPSDWQPAVPPSSIPPPPGGSSQTLPPPPP
jgi:cell division protein FtsW (lipid II flippase)